MMKRPWRRHAWSVLSEWTHVPGLRDDETIDGEHLTNRGRQARHALSEADRADIGDDQFGQVLATSPPGNDGIWPAEPIGEIIEDAGSSSLEAGPRTGVTHRGGVPIRGVSTRLGARRRQTVWEAAKQKAREWPRTSWLLRRLSVRRLSVNYERDAEREGAEAEISSALNSVTYRPFRKRSVT